MKRVSITGALGCMVAALSTVACSSSTEANEPIGETGGTHSGGSGFAGSGPMSSGAVGSSVAGSGAVGNSAGAAGSPSTVPACSMTGVPLSWASPPRRLLPWQFAAGGAGGITWIDITPPRNAGGANTGGTAGAANAGAANTSVGEHAAAGSGSGCTYTKLYNDDITECAGTATAHVSGETLLLSFADNATLTWDKTLTALLVPAPAIADGSSVWVSYSHRLNREPFQGSWWNQTISVRKEQAGALLWYGRDGHWQKDLEPELVQELFGVPIHEQLVCKSPYESGCYNVVRSVFDHVLETSPEQIVPHATLTRVNAPQGEFDIVWAHSTEDVEHIDMCNDGPGVASDTGFAASRRGGS